MIYEADGSDKIKELFGDWQETMIWSCIQGIMGRLYTDNLIAPRSVMAILGDFCFFAGEPSVELLLYKPGWCNQNFMIMTAREPEWLNLIEQVFGENAKKVSRYAIKKEPEVFNEEKLNIMIKGLDRRFTLRTMNESLFYACKKEVWSRDFVSLYSDYDEYRKIGMGVVALNGETIVSGASSYCSYQGGIEIEVDTREDFRRQGLAAACSAKLILECLKRRWYPSWDAQNLWSVALAEKLGYHFDHEYTAYEITDD